MSDRFVGVQTEEKHAIVMDTQTQIGYGFLDEYDTALIVAEDLNTDPDYYAESFWSLHGSAELYKEGKAALDVELSKESS